MNDKNIRTFVGAAMMTALCAVLTSVVKIPSPMGGYFNLGDCGVLLSAWLLGPAWGAAAAGLGSALSDLLGYPLYAPATLVIKALMAALKELGAPVVLSSHERLVRSLDDQVIDLNGPPLRRLSGL